MSYSPLRASGQEMQIAGPNVMSYAEMLERMAHVPGRRPRPMIPLLRRALDEARSGAAD